VFLVRVNLPDRPGSLGAVATAFGTVKADIVAVEIVEKYEGYAVDDFMLELPQGTPPDALYSACASLEGVEVVWVSYYPETWGLQADVDVLERMTEQPEEAETILVDAVPHVFHTSWALLVDRDSGQILHRTPLAPEPDTAAIAGLGDLASARTFETATDWVPGWQETILAVAPFRDPSRRSLIAGRTGGPDFLASEVARLRHLAALIETR
jgi:hypothetical protein